MTSFRHFYIFFHPKTFSLVFVALYKGLSKFLTALLTWETFSDCLIALDNSCKVFGCSILTDFMSTIFGFSKAFGC